MYQNLSHPKSTVTNENLNTTFLNISKNASLNQSLPENFLTKRIALNRRRKLLLSGNQPNQSDGSGCSLNLQNSVSVMEQCVESRPDLCSSKFRDSIDGSDVNVNFIKELLDDQD